MIFWRGSRTRATFGQPQRGDFSRLNIGRRESSSANENLHHDHRMSGIRSQAIELSDELQQPSWGVAPYRPEGPF